MSKTLTLRVSEDHYHRLKAYAKAENRKLSNALETLALKQLDEEMFVDPLEMQSILSDGELLGRLKTGHGQAKKLKGRFVE
jgi:TfoX/Sxy family transcriptional regulator of competence genes